MTLSAQESIRTVELIGWDLDDYALRPHSPNSAQVHEARLHISQRSMDHSASAWCEQETRKLHDAFKPYRCRADLQSEMSGLDWSLGIVDLRQLLAFQRRVSFHPGAPSFAAPAAADWPALLQFCFAPPRPVCYHMVHDAAGGTIRLQSSNPNLHLRVQQKPEALVAAHAGSPFFEVAHYAGRWFLRDGYHRAYTLLRAGVVQAPAVIVRARTLEELGAVRPWFFPEAILLSGQPPMVSDFLNPRLTLEYLRPPTITTLRITLEESIAPASATTGEPS
jgi:hypothetical protein